MFSPDGTRVVTASEDKTAQVWDAATGKPITRPLEHQAAVVSAAFSLDGTSTLVKMNQVCSSNHGRPHRGAGPPR